MHSNHFNEEVAKNLFLLCIKVIFRIQEKVYKTPKFGSFEFSSNFDKRIPNSWRDVSGPDAIPQYPQCKKLIDKDLKSCRKILRKKPSSNLFNPHDRNGYYYNCSAILYPIKKSFLYTQCTRLLKNEDFHGSDGLIFCRRNLTTNHVFIESSSREIEPLFNERIAQNLYLLAHESYYQDAGRCIPKNVLICDKLRDKCGYYILVSKVERIIIIAFSGSINAKQTILQTINSFRERVFYKNLGSVNHYYVNSFERLWPFVKRVFYKSLYKNYKVYITGHSLGGVHASLAAINIHLSKLRKSQDIFLYTFGEPRFASLRFAINFDRRIPNSWRVVSGSDIVPHFPPCKKMNEMGLNFLRKRFRKKRSKPCDPHDYNGYYHHSREIWYPIGTANYFITCNGFPRNEDFQCSDKLIFQKRNFVKNMDIHCSYFDHLVRENFAMFYYKADEKCNIKTDPKNRRQLLLKQLS
uniref:Lipase_3 domain-containing protein n=1 Tax=Strongyloides venezuelensis TaxID=75913 RepID=A0A0K0F3P8_STRVS